MRKEKYRLKFMEEQRLNSDMYYYSDTAFHLHRCIFIHIPKTAGVAFSQSLFKSLGFGHKSIRWYQKNYGSWKTARYWKFTIVREPIDRFLSAVNYLDQGGMSNFEFSKGDEEWANKHIRKYSDINNFINKELDFHIEQSIHFFPQVFFCKSKRGKIDVDYIGYFHEIAKCYSEISEKLGISTPLMAANQTKVAKRFSRQDLSQESINRLKKKYKEDYLTFDF